MNAITPGATKRVSAADRLKNANKASVVSDAKQSNTTIAEALDKLVTANIQVQGEVVNLQKSLVTADGIIQNQNNTIEQNKPQVAYAEKLSAKGVKAELSADSQSFLAHHCKEITVADVVKVHCKGIVSSKCDAVLNDAGKPTDYSCMWGNYNLNLEELSLSPKLLGFFNNVCLDTGYGFVCKLPIYQTETGAINEACNDAVCEWELSL